MVVPLFVGREKTVRALEEVMKGDKQILLVAQKNPARTIPAPEDIYDSASLATVLQLLKLPDGTVKVLVEGGRAAASRGFTDQTEFYEADAVEHGRGGGEAARGRGPVARRGRAVRKLREAEQEGAAGGLASIPQIAEPGKLADTHRRATCR